MDNEELTRITEEIEERNEESRDRAATAAAALAACGVEPSTAMVESFIDIGLKTDRLDPFFLAIKLGASAFSCLSVALRRWERDEPGRESRSEILRSLLVEVGPAGAIKPPVSGARIKSMMDLWAGYGDPVALSLALNMPGVDARRLAREPDIEAGRSPLSCAASSKAPGALACCEILLGLGADPNLDMNDDPECTALRFAVRGDNPEICFLLVLHGGDPTIESHGKRVDDGASEACAAAIVAGQELRAMRAELGSAPSHKKLSL